MGTLFMLTLLGLTIWWMVREMRKAMAEARSKRNHPSRAGSVMDPEPKRWNFHRLLPTKTTPTATDLLVARAPEPKDPLGTTKERDVRRILTEVQAEGERWQTAIPTVAKRCYLCGGNRFPIAGILTCANCDHHSPKGLVPA